VVDARPILNGEYTAAFKEIRTALLAQNLAFAFCAVPKLSQIHFVLRLICIKSPHVRCNILELVVSDPK
jgi:hypothetical protein